MTEDNGKLAGTLYGRNCGPLTSVYLVTRTNTDAICAVGFLHDGEPVIEVTPQLPTLEYINSSSLGDIRKCEFKNLADAFENQHKFAKHGEFLHQAGLVFWAELFPRVYRSMKVSSTLDLGTEVLGLMKINFDAINGICVTCAFEALTFAMAYGYLAYIKALNHRSETPKEMQTSEELQVTPFNKSARVVFRGSKYKVEVP